MKETKANTEGAVKPQEQEWEFDDRRWCVCEQHLQKGEELVWYEKDEKFTPSYVKKTLRRGEKTITFLVQNPDDDKVFTVGTLPIE